MALFQIGTSHCGTLSKWDLEILFRIIVALDQWEAGSAARLGAGGGEVTLKDLDHRQNSIKHGHIQGGKAFRRRRQRVKI